MRGSRQNELEAEQLLQEVESRGVFEWLRQPSLSAWISAWSPPALLALGGATCSAIGVRSSVLLPDHAVFFLPLHLLSGILLVVALFTARLAWQERPALAATGLRIDARGVWLRGRSGPWRRLRHGREDLLGPQAARWGGCRIAFRRDGVLDGAGELPFLLLLGLAERDRVRVELGLAARGVALRSLLLWTPVCLLVLPIWMRQLGVTGESVSWTVLGAAGFFLLTALVWMADARGRETRVAELRRRARELLARLAWTA